MQTKADIQRLLAASRAEVLRLGQYKRDLAGEQIARHEAEADRKRAVADLASSRAEADELRADCEAARAEIRRLKDARPAQVPVPDGSGDEVRELKVSLAKLGGQSAVARIARLEAELDLMKREAAGK